MVVSMLNSECILTIPLEPKQCYVASDPQLRLRLVLLKIDIEITFTHASLDLTTNEVIGSFSNDLVVLEQLIDRAG